MRIILGNFIFGVSPCVLMSIIWFSSFCFARFCECIRFLASESHNRSHKQICQCGLHLHLFKLIYVKAHAHTSVFKNPRFISIIQNVYLQSHRWSSPLHESPNIIIRDSSVLNKIGIPFRLNIISKLGF